MSAADPADASVDTDNPWLGLASFTEASRAYFYGREQEITELERRVQHKLLTVLFGKSRLGKTSILQAGLVPGLRARGYFPVYLRIDYGHDSPEASEQIKQAINRAAVGQGISSHSAAAPAIDPEESIWEFLHHRESAQIIGPVVQMYRTLQQKDHGDQWLPLELAEALYVESLTDTAHRPALLREAAGLVDHLAPAGGVGGAVGSAADLASMTIGEADDAYAGWGAVLAGGPGA